MKKLFIGSFTAVALLLSQGVYADAAVQDAAPSEVNVEEPAMPPPPAAPMASDEKDVGKASYDSASAAKRKNWQNIAIAVGAVTVATVALVLVGQHQGHGSH